MSDAIFFIAAAAGLAGQFLDAVTTEAALAHGWVEANPVAAWLIKKTNVATLSIFKCAGLGIGVPAGLYSLGYHYGVGSIPATIACLATAGVGFYAGIKNYLLEKKAGISVL